MIKVIIYRDREGRSKFLDWLRRLDNGTSSRVTLGLQRLAAGNSSNVQSVGHGPHELRLDFGPGYRIYFGRVGGTLIIVLAGGTKRRQSADIAMAHELWTEYKKRARVKGSR